MVVQGRRGDLSADTKRLTDRCAASADDLVRPEAEPPLPPTNLPAPLGDRIPHHRSPVRANRMDSLSLSWVRSAAPRRGRLSDSRVRGADDGNE
jgi:hypothetical protein